MTLLLLRTPLDRKICLLIHDCVVRRWLEQTWVWLAPININQLLSVFPAAWVVRPAKDDYLQFRRHPHFICSRNRAIVTLGPYGPGHNVPRSLNQHSLDSLVRKFFRSHLRTRWIDHFTRCIRSWSCSQAAGESPSIDGEGGGSRDVPAAHGVCCDGIRSRCP